MSRCGRYASRARRILKGQQLKTHNFDWADILRCTSQCPALELNKMDFSMMVERMAIFGSCVSGKRRKQSLDITHNFYGRYLAMAEGSTSGNTGAISSSSTNPIRYNGRMLRGVSTSTTGSRLQNSFSVEVAQELKGPMTKVFLIWFVISCLIIISNKLFTFGANDAVFVGSLFSLIGTLLILFSATNSEDHERKAFQFIFYLTMCDLLFAIKMLASACIVISGRSREWQDRHDGWCYFSALTGQFSAMASMGWSFSIVLDLLLIVFFPLHYGRKKKQYLIWYHYLVWGISSLSCIPAIATGNVGMSTDGTCWFLGNYVWCFWVVWYMFVGFSIPGIIALYFRLRHFHETTDSISMSYVRVVTQSVLITFTFFLCWFWNMLFRMIIANNSPFPPWLVPLQIFWLGALGFSNSIIWLPFIRLAIRRANERLRPAVLSMLNHSRTLTERSESLFPSSQEPSSSQLRESFGTGVVGRSGHAIQTEGQKAPLTVAGGSDARESYDEI